MAKLGWACGILAALLAARAGDAGEAGPVNEVSPGPATVKTTLSCAGINWHITGDDDRDASVKVSFRRKGTEKWRAALDLWRHEFQKTRMFSGSVFRLCPGTDYEFKLTLEDADGGGAEKIVAAKTLAMPVMPKRVVDVPAGGLKEAQERAAPGTVMLIHKGKYPAVALTKAGRAGEPIVYRSAGDGEVVIEGLLTVRASDVWLHGLTLTSEKHTVVGRGGKRFCVTGCRLRGHYAIHTSNGAEQWYVADNYLHGTTGGKFTFGGEGADFGSDKGVCRHVVCFNEFTEFADAVSYGRGDIDVHNNYIHETVDDFIEPDYGRENWRLWNNRCYNSMCGFSFQPMKGGPWYVFDNVNVGAYLHCLKVKEITGAAVVTGNTFLTKSSQLNQAADILRGTMMNNLWMRLTPGQLGYGRRISPKFTPTTVDHNAYGLGGSEKDEPFRNIGYKAAAAKYGWDKHSVSVSAAEVFSEDVKPPAGKPRYGRDLQGKLIPKDWHFEHYLCLPKAGSKVIDAGKALPNITGPYLGEAPDIGAHELGLGTAWYGMRTWDLEAGLVYGVPEGWKKMPVTDSMRRALRGLPEEAKAVVLRGTEPQVLAHFYVEPAAGEERWRRARKLVDDESEGAETPVLEFQDGLYVRLVKRPGMAMLVFARVEPGGVLRGAATCKWDDLDKRRVEMFQFVRSLVR